MLKSFESHCELEEVRIVCNKLCSLKKRIEKGNFSDPFKEYKDCDNIFDSIKAKAIDMGDESLANAQMIYRHYFKFFSTFASYHLSLIENRYKNSWDILQDCLDEAKIVGEFVDIKDRKEIPEIVAILLQYEKLYPYRVFASSEYIVSKSHCSICGKSMQSLSCPHRKGKLYWGDFAIEMIDEIKELQAVCLVSHPEDKRCIIELHEDRDIPEKEKFKKLDEFVKLKINPLQNFEIETKIEQRRDTKIQKVNRNDLCPCGSGKKFKRCCINRMYYNHERNIISPLCKVQLIIQDSKNE